jgi:polysaccharide chain length determinant protein (PEP-CTERM system associated)
VTLLDGRLQDQKLARDALRRELESTPRMLVTEAGGLLPGSGPAPLKLRLQEAEEQLRVLLLKDTEQHPDVIAQKKLIEALRAEQARRPAASANSAPSTAAGSRSASNPVYEQLRLKLVEADTNLLSLERQRDEAVRYRDRLEKMQRDQPGLIAEYQNLDRDYGVLRKNYEELLARLQSANIAQAADTQADKVKLQVIDPPEVPRLPASPNRLLLFTGVLMAGLGGGIAAPVLLGQLDQSFIAAEDLRRIGRPVLGGISLLGGAPARDRIMAGLRVGAAVAVLILIYGGLMLHVLRGTALI